MKILVLSKEEYELLFKDFYDGVIKCRETPRRDKKLEEAYTIFFVSFKRVNQNFDSNFDVYIAKCEELNKFAIVLVDLDTFEISAFKTEEKL